MKANQYITHYYVAPIFSYFIRTIHLSLGTLKIKIISSDINLPITNVDC